MNLGFWDRIEKPIIAQAPMADVTDAAFRRIIAKYGKPDVLWTEFVSCDGLVHEEAREKLKLDLLYSEEERPIVAQFFTSKPEHFYVCAQLAQELGFDGIDINMGCPVKTIVKQKACADLINDPELAKKIIHETKRGAGPLPVSVKTRVGYNTVTLENWLKHLLEEAPAAITLHARTAKEMSLVPARWEHIREAKEIIDASGTGTLLLGNGDVKSVAEAFTRVEETGADGVMIGRGIFGNPWLYANLQSQKKAFLHNSSSLRDAERRSDPGNSPSEMHPTPGVRESDTWCLEEFREPPSLQQRLSVLLEHARLFDELIRPQKSFAVMRKHFGSYVSGFGGAKELRMKLMEANSSIELEKIVRKAGFLG